MKLISELWWLVKVDFAGTLLGIAVSASIIAIAFGIVLTFRK